MCIPVECPWMQIITGKSPPRDFADAAFGMSIWQGTKIRFRLNANRVSVNRGSESFTNSTLTLTSPFFSGIPRSSRNFFSARPLRLKRLRRVVGIRQAAAGVGQTVMQLFKFIVISPDKQFC